MGRASLPEKGGDAMQITYAELFQFCPVIIGLCMQAKKEITALPDKLRLFLNQNMRG